MNKRQTRLFAIIATAICVVAFIGMTIDSHRQFPTLTNADKITPAVSRGNDAWHKNNCINCHTLFGEGAYYAPDLTKITQQRGEAYLKAYLADPSKFYDEQHHRRLMPKQDLSPETISDIIAFLDWVSHVDNQDWPPRPIRVSGATLPLTPVTETSAASQAPGAPERVESGTQPAGAASPIARGERLFREATPACVACHSTAPGVNMAGPSLAGISAEAARVVASPEYKGKAKDAAGFIHESIVEPSAYVVPGPMFSAGGVSFMPATYGKDLSPEQVDDLVAYLMSIK
jgi:nitric oxide reductase subunit C